MIPSGQVGQITKWHAAAALLYANAEGCAINHHEVDFEAHGLPGWLADAKADIEAARSAIMRLEDYRK